VNPSSTRSFNVGNLHKWESARPGGKPLYEAAVELAGKLGIGLAALPGTEKRNP
jgi:hypothetical protein